MPRRKLGRLLPSIVMTCWLLLLASCGAHSMTPAEYPPIQVQALSFRLTVKDVRQQLESAKLPPASMYRGDSAVSSQALPKAFGAQARERLRRLVAGRGPKLEVEAEVLRADVTFRNDGRDDFTRFDVELRFTIRTETGALLLKARGAAWNEMPSQEASLSQQREFFEFTSTQAMDNLLASEATLQKLNRELEAFASRPQ